ncbi:MAG: HPr family phosphocarrier protein [Candidatus Omnitrophica bacterium]|nr:HPr family phosphocarrier protein [Candidatus Omnitrophota bacterium]
MSTTTQLQQTVSRSVTVPCRQGVHLRVASVIVTMAKQFHSAIHFVSGAERVDAKSILGVLRLGAVRDTPLVLTANGPDADRAVQVLGELFESRAVLCRDPWELN